jgi:hypothetical protein
MQMGTRRFQALGMHTLQKAARKDVMDTEKIHGIKLEIERGVFEHYGSLPASLNCFRAGMRDALLVPLVRREIIPGDTVRLYMHQSQISYAIAVRKARGSAEDNPWDAWFEQQQQRQKTQACGKYNRWYYRVMQSVTNFFRCYIPVLFNGQTETST